MPATISAVLSSAMPVAAARQAGERVEQRDHDRHVGAADRQHDEVAEQRRRTTSMPMKSALDVRRRRRSPTPARDREQRAAARLTICCAAPSVIGRPGMISCSLPKAMFEPQKEIEPTIAANSEKIAT